MGEQEETETEFTSSEGNEVAKTFLRAMPLRNLSDIQEIQDEVTRGNIVILKITPLANKSIDDVRSAVNDLFDFTNSIGGDIARLGDERVVICPPHIRIWREKNPKQTVTKAV